MSVIATRHGPRVDVADIMLRTSATIEDTIACIDRSGRTSIALLVDEDGALINTFTDGDVRRGLLAGLRLCDSIEGLIPIKASMPRPLPTTAMPGTDDETLLAMMEARHVRQIPLVTPAGRVVDVVTMDDLSPNAPHTLQALVMAGGQGTRLRPLTADTPKPMLPVGGRPLMEIIIDQLRDVGIRKVNVATHYQAQKIVDHFGDGSAFGVDISYVNEEMPLGTGGALGLMRSVTDPILVINGDILTDVDFRSMYAYHLEHNAKMTVAVRRYEVQVPYGVVECDGPRLSAIREKPSVGFFVNAGIYLLDPGVYRYISHGEHLNMTDLIETLIVAGEPIVSFPVREYWLDIGQHADYERAQCEAAAGHWPAKVRAGGAALTRPLGGTPRPARTPERNIA